MTGEDLLLREDTDFEAKAAQGRSGRGELPHSVWETYSAMANSGGGRVLLGAREEEDGTLTLLGIAEPHRVRKALWDGLNNRQVVSHNLLGDGDVELRVVEGVPHPVILLTIPSATRVQRPVYLGANPLTGTYRRNFEGDYRCDPQTVRRMLAEAERDTRDGEVLTGFGLADLDGDTLAAYRNVFRSTKPGHPWLALDDRDILRRLGGWAHDREHGVEGLTLAGLLMFGQLHTILEAVPNYIVDYREHMDAAVRWTDRLTTDGTWSGNLFDFYRRVYPRLVQDLKVPFRLEAGAHRVDDTPVHEAVREALVNTLIHADYHLSTAIVVARHPDRFELRNPGTMRIPRPLALRGGVSDCRNRNLQKMFQMIGEGEQAGSGMPRIVAAWRGQHWRAPLLAEEADPEFTRLTLTMISLLPTAVIEDLEGRFGPAYQALPEVERLALATAAAEGRVTNERLREISAEHPSDLTLLLRRLVAAGYLERHGSRRGAFYQLPVDEETAPSLAGGEGSSVAASGILNPRQRKAVEWVRQHGSISNEEYRELTEVSHTTAIRDLRRLVAAHVLQETGRARSTRYVVPTTGGDVGPGA